MTIPIAIFAFDRPERLGRLLDSLKQCDGFEDTAITIFIDGAKNPEQAERVARTLTIAEAAARPGWSIVARDVNFGLKRSISSGVSQVCARHGRAIVLEDDLIVSKCALSYFTKALDKYQDEDRVWNVCGYMYTCPELAARSTDFFLPMTHPWGWATWERSWSKFDIEERLPAPTTSKSFRTAFDCNGIRDFTSILELSRRNLLNSWFIEWNLKLFTEGALSLFPHRSHVANMGLAAGGTHSSGLNPYNLLAPKRPPFPEAIGAAPDDIRIDFEAMDLIAASRDARIQTAISTLGKIKRGLRRKRS
jgi:hypothetical protein